MTDIEIAQACEMRRIGEVAAEAGIAEEYLEPYGRYKAKISLRLLAENPRPDGKLILVTAITPTPLPRRGRAAPQDQARQRFRGRGIFRQFRPVLRLVL